MQFIDSHPWVMQLVGPTVLLISVCLVFRQLRANLRANRRSQYLTAFEFSENYFENAIFHWRDHFEEATYTSLYSGNEDRCRSYLLMMRKYMYLLYQHRFQDEISAGCERWMWELAAYQEFRDAHKSTGRYYPAFSRKVDKAIELTALKGWYYLEPNSPVNVPS